MRTKPLMAITFGLGIVLGASIVVAQAVKTGRIEAAEFTDDGKLVSPADLEEWVFLTSSYAMGYDEESFDAEAQNMFQVVKMEPQAFRYFVEHGVFAEGSMFLLSFFGSETNVSNNRTGFVMGEPMGYEIHIKDSEAYMDKRAFYLFENDGGPAAMLPSGNDCVTCHERDGAYDGIFAQFYPGIRERLPASAMKQPVGGGHD